MMDLKKCRTCFIDLDANDLFLKLDLICKNSKLTLGEKLKICVPKMDLKDQDQLYICMQCSMHLETAYSFHITCLKTEEEFQKHISGILSNIQDDKNFENTFVKEERKKTDHMNCHICNINFSSRNIFDLHMKVMHPVNESMCKTNDEKLSVNKSKKIQDKELDKPKEKKPEALKDKKIIKMRKERKNKEILKEKKAKIIESKKKTQNTRPLLQMVVLQTNIRSSLIKDSKKNCESESKEEQEIRKKLAIEQLKENRKIMADTLKRDRHGRFLKPKPKLSKTRNKELSKPKPKLNKTIQEVAKVKPHLNNIKVSTQVTNKNKQENILDNTNRSFIKCKYCTKKFLTPGTFTRHLNKYHKDKCKLCHICQRYFTDIKQHKKMYNCQLKETRQRNLNVTDTNLTYCLSQDTKFFYIIEDDKQPICVICGKKKPTETALKDHMVLNHKGGIGCKNCPQSFSVCNYSIHVAIKCTSSFFNYTTDGECICPLCNKVETRNTNLFKHLSQHAPEDFKCRICYRTFDTFRLFTEHIVLGCTNIKIEQEKSSTVFVEANHESDNQVKTVTQTLLRDDPLAEYYNQKETNSSNLVTYDNQMDYSNSSGIESSSTTIDVVLDKNIKVEPTELLDQNIFVLNENSTSNDQPPQQILDIECTEDIMDSPELIYVVSQSKE